MHALAGHGHAPGCSHLERVSAGRATLSIDRLLSRRDLHDHFLYGVVAVAVAIPVRQVGLGTAGEIGSPGSDRVGAGLVKVGEQFPPLPAVPVTVPDQAGLLPRTVVDAHLDSGDGGRA